MAAKQCAIAGPPAEKPVLQTDRSKCIFCQDNQTTEPLKCPVNSLNTEIQESGYITISQNLVSFAELDALPFDIARLDNGQGVQDTLKTCEAKWHKSCQLKYTTTKLSWVKKRSAPGPSNEVVSKFTRSGAPSTQESLHCFFCDKIETSKDKLHNASTFKMDNRVRTCALQLQDESLLAKLSAGDMVAQDAVYHSSCLVALYNKADRLSKDIDYESPSVIHGIALAELVSYIEDARMDPEIAQVFKMSDLTDLYTTRIRQLGQDVGERVHSSRLKERLLSHFPYMDSYKQGRDVFLAFKEDIGHAINVACKRDNDDEGIALVKAANIVRREMLQTKKNQFLGSFPADCQHSSMPETLLALVSMILEGPNIKNQSKYPLSQATLSLSQLLLYNSHARSREGSMGTHHLKDRETPVHLHTKTRKKQLADAMYELGLSIPYDRVLDISTVLANSICTHFSTNEVVCPPQLHHDRFTVAAADNIDHNPSSTTAKGTFHGTGVSLFQQPPHNWQALHRPG